jgi:hypothetical protein
LLALHAECYNKLVEPRRSSRTLRSSSVVEQSAVNRLVVGSNPTCGAKLLRNPCTLALSLFVVLPSQGRESCLQQSVRRYSSAVSDLLHGRGIEVPLRGQLRPGRGAVRPASPIPFPSHSVGCTRLYPDLARTACAQDRVRNSAWFTSLLPLPC